MESTLFENQQELYGAMIKIATNLKKDSADRKSSVDYFKRRSETLEAYWKDYQYNHDRLSMEESRAHPYFINSEFEKANEVYKTTKALISEQYQVFVKGAKVSVPTTSGTQQQESQQEGTGRSRFSEQVSNQEDTQQTSSAARQASRGSSSKLDDMLKRQASNFRAFVRTVSGIDLNIISQKWELEDVLRTLQSRWSIIDSLHLELDSELEGMDETYERSFTKHENTYNEIKKAINSKLWSVSYKEKWTPKMEIPNFSGNYNQWTSFKDLFVESIHNNILISNAQKMQFLKGKLKGEAERLVQHLQISTENYSIAWEILNNRYNNIRLIFTTHANTLLNLPTTQHASVAHIKRIHDTTLECLNAIKKLGVDTSSWDPLIVHILLQKVDTESHNHYLESLKNPRDLPTLGDFLKFLEIRFTTLESSRKKQENPKSSYNAQNNSQNSKFAKFNNYSKQSLPAHKGGQSTEFNKSNSAKVIICPLCKEAHGLYFCSKFLNMSPQEKLKTVKKINVCENCLFDHKKQSCVSEKWCRECQGKHNTLLHEAYDNPSVNITISDKNVQQDNNALQQGNNGVEILLATALIKVQAGDGSYHKMRALIDQGSQISLISEKAAQVLSLARRRCKGVISGIGAKESSCKGVATISCQSLYNTFSFKTEVFIMNTLIKNLPSYTFNKPTWSHLDGIQLSDTDFHVSRPVDILLGADVYSHIIMDGISRSEEAVPVAQQTRLGWILCGNVQTYHCNVVLNQVDELQKFWEIEDITEASTLSEEDNQCVNYYKSTTTRRDDGSYEVRIPFKENFEQQLGSSKHTAIAQFHQLERKFQSNKYIEQEYKSFIKEYESLGHMKLSMGNLKPDCYLPHHCVLRSDSSTTALRVVFNASRKTTSGKSLNDLMLKGPNLQQDLQCLLLKWRQFRYAFTADIEKMFRFIWINEHDQRFQKIIWRDSTDSLLGNYQLCTITYGTKAVIYCKLTANNTVKVSLVAGKSRLVPTSKTVSLPRLELSGALLLAKLMTKVQECLDKYIIKIHCWVDSMVVLAWLQGDPGRWKPFVANRVRQITETISPEKWRYVKSAENPADCASRGMSVTQLKEHTLWWKGPSWLPNHSSRKDQGETFTTDEEVKSSTKQVNHSLIIKKGEPSIIGELLTRFSSLQKLTRVLAWILRFINYVKCKQTGQQNYLTLQDINSAKHKIIKYVQQTQFSEEINNLQRNKSIKGKLLPFNPFLDKDGLLRVGGRLNKANLTPDMRHPIILPHNGYLTDLVIDHAHKLTLHGGARVTLATIRQKYWIIGGNRAVKKRLHNCVSCRKHNPKKMTQLMGDLPSERCNVAKVFYHTGVDYTGHVFIKANKGRGIKTTKGYVAVFICMVTKLVHLELVSDLTSSAFLAALRRMAARKGSPKHIYCDNGTNFVGASNVLAEEYQQITQTFDQDLIAEMTDMEIEWHFNAPSWPSAAGLWEAAVKSVKHHLRRVIGKQRLTFEEYSTILAQTEAILNSRPLCPLTEDPDDLEFLTPSSFININQDMTIMETETDMRTRWFVTQKIVQDIWKRWRSEYLTQLTARSKWRSQQHNIQINDVVTINDANLPPGKWSIGRVVELHPGSDGHVRVVTLKTKTGLIKRPIVKLSILPVNNRKVEPDTVTSDDIPTKNQSKRSGHSFVSLMTLLLFFMGIIGTCSSYNMTRLKDNQGLYFDKISNMRLIRDEWKIVSYYDMNPYWQGTAACSKYIKYLTQVCNQLNKTSYCDIITEQLLHEYSELEYYNHLLLNQHSSTRRDKRRRRGLINGVGFIANSLFGVLDERFAEQYKNDILLLQYNDDHLASLIKNQTSIIEVEYNVLKRTENSISKQYKVLNQLSIRLNNFENDLKTEAQRNIMSSDFSMAAIAASNIIRRLQTMQSTLLDTITDIYHGRFNLHLISPEQLKQTLSIISSHLTKDLSLPIANIQTDLKSIYSLFKVKARTAEDYILFEIRLPLVTRDLFEIMHILSVPKVVRNASMARIMPIAEYVAIDLRKESYLILSEHEIKACLHNGVDAYLCYSKSPIYQLKNDEDLCDREQSTGKCKLTISMCTNEWVEMNKINKYMYFCCEKCHIRALCENSATAGQLEKAGILSIEQGCIIKTENFTIFAHSNDSSNIHTRDQFYVQEIEPINHMINISITDSLPSNSTPAPNDVQLEDIRKQINDLKAHENLVPISYHDVHHYTAIYVILGIIVVCGAVIMGRKLRRACTKQVGTSEQVTAAVAAASAAAAVARVEQASPQPSVSVQRRASVGAPSARPTPCVYSVSYSVSERDKNISESRTSVNSEIPLVHKLEKCTTPMPRRANFS